MASFLRIALNAHFLDELVSYRQQVRIVLDVRSANQVAAVHHQGGHTTNLGFLYQQVALLQFIEDAKGIKSITEFFAVYTN